MTSIRLCESANRLQYGGVLTEQPQSPILLIDGKNAIKYHENGFDRVDSPCGMGISFRLDEIPD